MAGPSSLARLQSTPGSAHPLAATGIATEKDATPHGTSAHGSFLPPISSLRSQGPWPTAEQQRDIAALSTVCDSEIFSTLASLRSLPAHLSTQHLQALTNLRSVPDDYIQTWLACGRRFSARSQSERSSLVSNISDNRCSAASWTTNNTSLSGISSLSQPLDPLEGQRVHASGGNLNPERKGKPSPDLNKPQPLPPPPVEVGAVAPDSRTSTYGSRHERWCTTREHETVYTTYRSFAKHENEHDKCYVFLPYGPIESTPWGPQCALCETMTPSTTHLQYHDTLKYDGRLGTPTTRSRRSNFEKLLRKHRASEEKIKLLVDKWCQVRKKRAYSCGFCINTFTSLPVRTNHIDREHYWKGRHIDEWDDNLVIKGLLLQPEVKEECLRLFPVDPTLTESNISWPPDIIKELQLRLEAREEGAQDLATDVFRLAKSRGISTAPRNIDVSCLHQRQAGFGANQPVTFDRGASNLDASAVFNPIDLIEENGESFARQQAQAFDDRNTSEVSHLSVSTPPSKPRVPEFTPQSVATSSVAYDNDNTDSMNAIYDTAHRSAWSPFTPYTQYYQPRLDGTAQSNTHGMGTLAQHYLNRPMPDGSLSQFSSFDSTASAASLRTALPTSLDQIDISQPSFDLPIVFPPPKRKLSDKTAKEANAKSQTQAPVSIYNQQNRTHDARVE